MQTMFTVSTGARRNPGVEAIDADGADAETTADAPKGGIGLKREDTGRLHICRLLAISAFVCCFLVSAPTRAQLAYITNSRSNTISVIKTSPPPNSPVTVIATIDLRGFMGGNPSGVAVAPDDKKVDVTNSAGFLEIDTTTNKVLRQTVIGASEGVAVVRPGPPLARFFSRIFFTTW
jgi:hypothetical protein